jgi:regulator of ribonuclease activity A
MSASLLDHDLHPPVAGGLTDLHSPALTWQKGIVMIWTADLCDEHGDKVALLDTGFCSYGGQDTYAGPVTTLSVFEDNVLVRAALEEPGGDRVLLVAGGSSTRCALLGGELGLLAVENGWAGVVVDGCVRDHRELRELPIGVSALGTCPRKSQKTGVGERDVPVEVAGVEVFPGDWMVVDPDGILVGRPGLFANQ